MILPTETSFHHADGTELMERNRKTFPCVGLRPLPTHQIMVVVADRDFDTAAGDPTVAKDDGRTAVATWMWNAQDCPQQ